MARKYVLGGQAATGLQSGIPYIKRIMRFNGTGPASTHNDGLSCTVVNSGTAALDGVINFVGANGQRKDFNAGQTDANGHASGGELLMVEFPSTTRSLAVTVEEAVSGDDPGTYQIRCQVLLAADGQDLQYDEAAAGHTEAAPTLGGNFIELVQGETATINARTKVVFLRIQKFATSVRAVTDAAGVAVGQGGHASDRIAILLTAVLDHENQMTPALLESNSRITDGDGNRSLKEIWWKRDGIN